MPPPRVSERETNAPRARFHFRLKERADVSAGAPMAGFR